MSTPASDAETNGKYLPGMSAAGVLIRSRKVALLPVLIFTRRDSPASAIPPNGVLPSIEGLTVICNKHTTSMFPALMTVTDKAAVVPGLR